MRDSLRLCWISQLPHDRITHIQDALRPNRSASRLGGHKNGQLLRLIADAAAFDVFVTMDKNLSREHKAAGLPFAIVILRARSNRFEDTHLLMPEVLRRRIVFI